MERKSAHNINKIGVSDNIRYGSTSKIPLLSDIIAKSPVESPEIYENLHQGFEKQLIREHLESLNEKLSEANLSPEFSLNEILFSPSQELPYIEKTLDVIKLTDSLSMPIISAIFGYNENGKPIKGQFAPLMFTEQYHQQKGNLQVVICSKDSQNYGPQPKPQGEINISKDLLLEINEQLSSRGRKNLPENLTEKKSDAEKIVSYQIFDQNSRFYTVLVMETTFGHKIPLLFNRLGSDGSDGEVSVIKLADNSYGMVSVPRPLFGKIGIEAPRGMADKGLNKFRELSEEMGVNVTKEDFVSHFKMMQDPTTDNVTPDFNVINFHKLKEISKSEDLVNQSSDGFESTLPFKTSADTILRLLKTKDIYDAHTIAGVLTAMLINDDLVINPMIKDEAGNNFGVILDEVFLPQTGKYHLVIPRGPINQGIKIGEIIPDSGKTRVVNPVSFCTQKDLDTSNAHKHVNLSEIIEKAKKMELDIITLSSLCFALMEKGYLVSKESIQEF